MGDPPFLTTDCPREDLKKIAWNPFNLVVGPLTEYRVGDPADSFDDIRFRELPKFTPDDATNKAEALARLEFNEHIVRLKRISNLMDIYLITPAPQDVTSLQTLLKSCVPAKYKHLNHGSLNNGSLLHPALWKSFSLDAEEGFVEAKDTKKVKNALAKSVIAYVSKTYLPEPDLKPVDQFEAVLDPQPQGITSDPAEKIEGGEKQLLDRPKCTALIEGEIKKLASFAKQAGLRVHVVGPVKDPLRQDIISNVAASVADLNKKLGYKMVYAALVDKDLDKTEVRIYMR